MILIRLDGWLMIKPEDNIQGTLETGIIDRNEKKRPDKTTTMGICNFRTLSQSKKFPAT